MTILYRTVSKDLIRHIDLSILHYGRHKRSFAFATEEDPKGSSSPPKDSHPKESWLLAIGMDPRKKVLYVHRVLHILMRPVLVPGIVMFGERIDDSL
jgi:hypothetical protein